MSRSKKRVPVSTVECVALEHSGRQFIYPPTEKIPVIEVDNYPALGRLTAFRFIEWVLGHPEGVISLPVGKAPEHFIRYVVYLMSHWTDPAVRQELESFQIDPSQKPDMRGLRFVQTEEFYPINPKQNNSFHYFIQKYYIRQFGLDSSRALLFNAWEIGMPRGVTPTDVFEDEQVDLSLRNRYGRTKQERLQKSVIEQVDQYCTEYEESIRDLGGIGFYLGGIGSDGHISFNTRGSDHFSTTRLTPTNYETQATAATDLGGIEVARKRLVLTVGLATLTYNSDITAIILAAGADSAQVIKESIESAPTNTFPATALQKVGNSRFFLTRGAASMLVERRYEDIKNMDPLPEKEIEKIVLDLSVDIRKRLKDLNREDFKSIRSPAWVLKTSGESPAVVTRRVKTRLEEKIKRGLEAIEGHTFMHTAPHHDDIMLGYWAYVIHLVRSPSNQHYFNYMTSGFNAVTNKYAEGILTRLLGFLDTELFRNLMDDHYFDPDNSIGQDRDVYQYLDGVAAHSRTMKSEGEARRLMRNISSLFDEDSIDQLKYRISEMILYFQTQYPGKKDLPYIQQFKGMIREWEADLLWGYLGFNSRNVNHLRLGFYGGGLFASAIDQRRDVEPVLNLIRQTQPTVVTVAYDPEGSGPGTHYKVLQTLAQALYQYQEETGRTDIQVWGYRNVWFRFHPAEADIVVPVSLNSLASLENAFNNCFGSQREASFPSPELDGPFSRLSQRIMVEQYQWIKQALGREVFNESEHPRLRATHGMLFLKTMTVEEFYNNAYELKKSTENVGKEQSTSDSNTETSE